MTIFDLGPTVPVEAWRYDRFCLRRSQALFKKITGIEDEMEDRIYNLMLQAKNGSLNGARAKELDRALTAYERLQSVKEEYQEHMKPDLAQNATDITGTGITTSDGTDPAPVRPTGRLGESGS